MQFTVEVVGGIRKSREHQYLPIKFTSFGTAGIPGFGSNQFLEFREFGISGGADFHRRLVGSRQLFSIPLQILQPPLDIKVCHLEFQALAHLERCSQFFVIIGVNLHLRRIQFGFSARYS